MEPTKKYQSTTTNNFVGILLALVFLFIPLAQTLHSHPSSENIVKVATEKSISSASERCLICEYAAEIKGKQIWMSNQTAINIPVNVCAELNAFVYTRIYKLTLQNFSNKGPPSLMKSFS